MANGIITLDSATFAEKIAASEVPILVHFWAEWCVPCKMIAPILDEIDNEHGDKITISKLNVDNDPDIAREHQVMSIPTLLVFKDGEVAKRIVGAKSKAALLADLSEFL